jgi:hypothetical protein
MINKINRPEILTIALVFGLMIVGCDNDLTGGGNDTWTNVTSLSQINGTWKAPPAFTGGIDNMNISARYTNYTVTFNAAAKTMSNSGAVTMTYSGGDIDTSWPILKASLESIFQQDGVTVIFNDAKYSFTITYSNYSMLIPDDTLTNAGFQINQNGKKLKADTGIGFAIIYTKQ